MLYLVLIFFIKISSMEQANPCDFTCMYTYSVYTDTLFELGCFMCFSF